MSKLYAYSDHDGFIYYHILEAGSVFANGQWLKREKEHDLVNNFNWVELGVFILLLGTAFVLLNH